MGDSTKIEWTDATWNPVTGCSVVSPGCTNCYAMRLAGTRLRHHPSRAGLTAPSKAGPVWTGEVRFNAQWLDQPLRWARPRDIFVCAHGDLFHEDVPDEWIDRVFAVMARAGNHRFQVLTKRSGRMRRYIAGLTRKRIQDQAYKLSRAVQYEGRWLFDLPLPNVWLGTSAERQQEADARIPDLIETLAAVHFLSLEPLLGPIDFRKVPGFNRVNLSLHNWWVIVGGESGAGARPMFPEWARSIRDQCAAAGVPYFHKQNGEFIVGRNPNPASPFQALDFVRVGKKSAGRLLDGVEHNGMPGDRP